MIIKTEDSFKSNEVYVVLGIDINGNDQVLALFRQFDDAKKYCVKFLYLSDFLDVWIEKHEVM